MVDASDTCGPFDGASLLVMHLGSVESVISFVCRRHHLTSADAEEFGAHVKLKLIENDYSILRKFGGRSHIRTYLAVVIERLFLDYRVSQWGKWRPSAAARRGGEVAMLIEQLLVRDGHSFSEAFELLTTNHGFAMDRGRVEAIAATLPVRIKRRIESIDGLADLPTAQNGSEIPAAWEDQAAVARVSDALRSAIQELDPRDQLVIMLRFVDGQSVAEIAAALHFDQKSLYRRFDNLLRQVRTSLELQGVDAALVRDLLDVRGAERDWDAVGMPAARPSMKKGADEWR